MLLLFEDPLSTLGEERNGTAAAWLRLGDVATLSFGRNGKEEVVTVMAARIRAEAQRLWLVDDVAIANG